jgi:glycosyltransferase involved in cell wall biosynthesis
MDERLTVMHVIAGLGTGGAETQLTNLVTAARADAPECIVVNMMTDPEGANTARLAAAGVETHHLGLTGFLTLPRTRRRLVQLIRERKPHVVQSWMYYGDILALSALCRSGRRETTRLYWGVRCSDMNLAQYSGRLRRAVAWARARSGLPEGVVVNSAAGRAAHERLGYHPRAWHLIENGIDTGRFTPGDRAKLRHQLGLPADRPIAVHSARIDPMKDHGTLLAGAEKCPGWSFIALGKGTETLTGPANFQGFGRRDDPELFCAAGDVILSTSAFGEGFSNVIAEGMAAEMLPVVTDVGDAARIVGETGFVVPPRDPVALAKALDAVAAMPRTELADRRRAARERVVERFAIPRMVERYDRLHRTGSTD